MKNKNWIYVAILSLLVINIVAVPPASCNPFVLGLPPQRPAHPLLTFFILVKTILSSLNSILLIILLVVYLGLYRKTASQFSFGLVIFSLALLLYSLTSNPVIQRLAGFRVSGLGPFTMIPEIFTFIASVILLYLSQQ
ncbi:hypothetical protein KAS14_06005 [Candidatus Bathyarchaeota archaeon]|nr:hypothetical protein [Candidatus Bathyarchaeota archaeon]